MSKILDLRQRRGELWDEAKAYLNEHEREDGTLSAEDRGVYEKMEADIVSMGKDIERLERAAELERELASPVGNAVTAVPGKGSELYNPKKETLTRASDAYNRGFWDFMRGRGIRAELNIGTDENGGYLVPDEFERQLVMALEEENFFRRVARKINTDSGERIIPIVKSHGEARWLDESAAFTESGETFDQITIGAYKLGTMIKITQELLNDSAFDMESYIANEFARRIGAAEEEAFLVGDGSKKPTGIFNLESEGVTAASNKITFDDIIDLVHSLKVPYRRKAAFIFNDSTLKALRKIKDSNGQYIWQPSMREGEPDRILSYNYYTSRFAPELSQSEKPAILFGDYSYYWIADRQARHFQRLNELYAPNGQIGFLAWQRVDGKLILPEAVTCLKAAGE